MVNEAVSVSFPTSYLPVCRTPTLTIWRGFAAISSSVMLASLCQFQEVVRTDASLLQDVRKRGSLDAQVGGDGELECLGRRMLLEADMSALLSDNNPSVPLQSTDDPIIGQARDLAHIATSSCSAFGIPAVSSSTGSRYSSITSRMFASASSLVSPSLMQPGTRAQWP